MLLIASAFAAISMGWVGYIPPIEELQNPINKFATQVYSADGKLMGTWSLNKDNRISVDYNQLPPHLVQALIATEDVRFNEHSGIDFKAVFRAVVKRGLMGQRNAGGGSTITQQLAKQLFSEATHNSVERMLQKPFEWVIAVKLERSYTKEEIIAIYLNYFDFLHNAVGIKNAAKTYFNKEPKDLTVNEAATLVGMCKNPSYFNPVRNTERCKDRRNVVLAQMVKAGYLTEEEMRQYAEEPLVLNFHRLDHKEGIAVYLREYLRVRLMAKKPERRDYPSWNMNKFYEDSVAWQNDPIYGWCNKHYNKDGEPYNIYSDGLRIYTTIDSRMQKYAEEAVYDHVGKTLQPAFNKEKRGNPHAPYSGNLSKAEYNKIINRAMRQSERYRALKAAGKSEDEIIKNFNTPVDMAVFTYHGDIDTTLTPLDSIKYYKSFLRSGFMSMDPKTGAVKAYVGGLDYVHFSYDMATGGRRQVGSTIKPFLYSLAMMNGATPCDLAPNVEQTYYVNGKPWTPRNGSRARYGENVTLKWGLAQSNNWISAYLMSKLNPSQLVNLIHQFGVMNPDIHPSMALCLGPCDISVAEMVSAYTAFANQGIRVAPMFISRIEDGQGNVISEKELQTKVNEVISEESAYKMLVLLRAVIDEGTGHRIRYKYNITCPMGGKTGTTNSNSDAWFVGFTPSLVSGCWVGGDDRDIHFGSMTFGQGAAAALPIWATYMKKVFADKSLGYDQNENFKVPEDFDPCANQIGDGLNIDAVEIDDLFE